MTSADANFLPARQLLESGVHFGHKARKLNPKMLSYIFGKRNQIHIIDVRQTIRNTVKAFHFLRGLAARGELILFVGTKRQARAVVAEQAQRCGMPYSSERWLGGTLTNYMTIRSRLQRLEEIERWETDGTMQLFSGKERASILRQKRKLVRNLFGIRNLDRLPACLLVVDPTQEEIALAEAQNIGAATVALIDTDGDPDNVDIPIPCNDDSMKVIQILLSKLADAILEGRPRPAEGAGEAVAGDVVSSAEAEAEAEPAEAD
jgi:small subunit ribosomal protein S2